MALLEGFAAWAAGKVIEVAEQFVDSEWQKQRDARRTQEETYRDHMQQDAEWFAKLHQLARDVDATHGYVGHEGPSDARQLLAHVEERIKR